MEQDVPSSAPSAQTGVHSESSCIPCGKSSPQGLHLCNLTPCEQERIEGEALASPVLLPAI